MTSSIRFNIVVTSRAWRVSRRNSSKCCVTDALALMPHLLQLVSAELPSVQYAVAFGIFCSLRRCSSAFYRRPRAYCQKLLLKWLRGHRAKCNIILAHENAPRSVTSASGAHSTDVLKRAPRLPAAQRPSCCEVMIAPSKARRAFPCVPKHWW